MRNFLRHHWKAIVAIIVLVVLAMFTVNPGAATPTPTLAARLRMHVAALTPGADDRAGPRQLQAAARYIETTLRGQGYAIRRREDRDGGQTVSDIEVSVANLAPRTRAQRIFIVGAHVGEAAGGTGGDAASADTGSSSGGSSGSGSAAVLELARLLKDVRPSLGTEIRFVFFFDKTGPWPASQLAGHVGDRPIGHFSGHFSGQDFIAFVGPLESSRLVQQALAAFQGGAGVPMRGLAAPAYVQGVTLSGHSAGKNVGDPAIMVTDTAFGRYPYYEATNEPAADAPADAAADATSQPDYANIARVVSGLARTIEALVAGQQS